MPIVTPKFIYDCRGSRHFLRELIVGQILIDGIDCGVSTAYDESSDSSLFHHRSSASSVVVSCFTQFESVGTQLGGITRAFSVR